MNEADTSLDSTTNAVRPKRRLRIILLVVIPVIAALTVGVIYLLGGRTVGTDNAYVKAHKVPVSAEVAGKIVDVLVHENEPVTAGQLLFRIDPAPFQVAVDEAQAKLAQVKTDLSVTKASYREQQAQIVLARTQLAFAIKDQKRKSDLVAKNFITASQLDDAKQITDLARNQVAVDEEGLKRIADTLGGNIERPVEQHPAYRAALADLDRAKLDLARVNVFAPSAGTVSKRPEPGQYLAAGTVAMAIVASANLWIEANFTETDLTHVRPGQPVAIRIDTYPDTKWSGVVDSVSPATGAEFSVIPAQNATGNWVKVTQRIAVRIKIDAQADAPTLRAGLSAVVKVDTGHRRSLFGLTM